jgi:hypothetical protein
MSDALLPLYILIYVIILVALATYTVVFKFNSQVRVFTATCDRFKQFLISKIKADTTFEFWKARGARFGNFRFQPRAEAVESIEWLLGEYTIRSGVVWVWLSVIGALWYGKGLKF